MDKNMMMILQLAVAIGFFFLFVWIFQMIYNTAVSALMSSTGSDKVFYPIDFWQALAILLLLMIVGGAFGGAKIIKMK